MTIYQHASGRVDKRLRLDDPDDFLTRPPTHMAMRIASIVRRK